MREQEIRDILFKEFLGWMRGQTVSLYEDGSINYYEHDVNAFIEKMKTGYDRQDDPMRWD